MSGGILTLSVETRQWFDRLTNRAEGRGQKARRKVIRQKGIMTVHADMISVLVVIKKDYL